VTFRIGNPSKLRHGHARRGQQSAEHRCWQAIKRRCCDPKNKKFKYYGGRGIKICDHWKDSFENFLLDVGPRPSPAYSIDRFPNRNGNYEPGNVRWATRAEQASNRDCTRIVILNGISEPLAAVCQRLGLNLKIVGARLERGWPLDKALTPPRWRCPGKIRRIVS